MMWDLRGSYNQDQPQTSQRNTPSPVFPSTQPAPMAMPLPSSYAGNTGYLQVPPVPATSSPQYHSGDQNYYQYPQQQQLAPRSGPSYQQSPPQVIIIKHSHRHNRRHRTHSHSHSQSHSQPLVIPQPIIQSNSHPSYYQTPAIIYPQPQPYLPSNQSSYSTGNNNYVPQSSTSRPSKQEYTRPEATLSSSPYNSGSSFQYSRCTGRKKAVCVGINYRGQSNELRGCINDARNVRRFLIDKHGYRSEDIVLLTDDTSNPRHLPTRQNMVDAMKWLVRSARPHDSLFFHYSGHGGQVEDEDGDEVDGFDEVIFPLDFKEKGQISDDEMHEIMVLPLPAGCRLTALFDSCHSGTVLDLPYIYSSHARLKGEHVRGLARKRKATPADVISWSGCKDGQTSADTFQDGVAVGAMSHAFVQSLTDQPKQSYQQLLRSVRLLLQPRYSQKPQLGSSHHIDTNLQFII